MTALLIENTAPSARPIPHSAGGRLVTAVMAALAIPAALLTSQKTRRLLLAVVVLNISLRFEKHFFLREDVRDLGSLGGLQITLGTIALLGLWLAWLVRLAIAPRDRVRSRANLGAVLLPAGLYVLCCAASLIAAPDTSLGFFEVCSVLERFLMALYVAKALTSRDDVLFVLRVLIAGLVVQSLLMLAQAGGLVGNVDAFGFKARADFAGVFGDRRISGSLGSPNPAAAYLAMMMAVALGVIVAGVSRVDKYLAGAGLALAILPLVLTLSRGGWLSLATCIAMFAFFGGPRVPRKAIAGVIMLGLLLLVPFAGMIQDRLYGDDDGSVASRMPLNALAGAMIKDHPLLGVGANNFAVAMNSYLAHDFSGDFLYTVHNTYLLVCSETGVFGLLAFVWFLIAIIRQGSIARNLREPLWTFPALGCAAAIAGLMVQMNFDPFRGDGAGRLLWLCGGLVCAMTRVNRPEVRADYLQARNSRDEI